MARRQRRKALPEGVFDAHITALSHDGRGIAHIDGKVTFIDNALPNEQVRFAYTFQRKQFDEGRALEIVSASSDRVAPPCQHANVCGGCSLQHMESSAQVRFKQAALLEQFEHIAGVSIPELYAPLISPTTGYRRKARLAVKHVPKKGKVLVGFREKRNNFIADLAQCEVLVSEVGHCLNEIAALIESLEARAQIPQIEIARGDDAVVALIFRHLAPLNEQDIARLRAFCARHSFHLYLQSGSAETVKRVALRAETLEPRLHYALPDYGIRYAFHPCDFTQVNGDLNRLMIARVMELLALTTEDVVLDLFCGLGNFSLPIAKQVKQLVGVEGSDAMVQRAHENAALNNLMNTRFFTLNLEQNLSELKKDKSSWVNMPFNKMLIDPPRSGALSVVEQIDVFSQVQRLVYVSCNPATLARDTAMLVKKGFTLQGAGVMDMFPHTNHVESLALFVRD